MATSTPLADIVRARSPITRQAAAKLLGLSERSVTRLMALGQLAEPARFGNHATSPLMFDLADVLVCHVRRVLGDFDEDQDQDDELEARRA